ncbi:MAG: tRNA (adenosine(37)-N6)-dimethylallyltransferase MiaA [Gammaproteobacteria bacterium]|nr:tRNA (adenosine(37)-N6)-dimethylallyltransferase MiaA [Gammaproteobacteria bacterium]
MIPAVCLMGPTASGKTELALRIAAEFPCEIISVDSVMVYRHMDIGSAKPGAAIRQAVPHHLIDILDPVEIYSVANFRADALGALREIHGRGRIPLLVGGTMLYFRALLRGLSNLPRANSRIREEISRQAKKTGWKAVHAQLAQVDPKAALHIHPNDPQRIGRALEVYRASGIPISVWHVRSGVPKPVLRALKIALIPQDRSLLHQRISERFDEMLKGGFLGEVEALWRREDLHDGLPSIRSVGYRQAWNYLGGVYSYETMREKVLAATRQLAKRQLTWLRSETGLTRVSTEPCDIDNIYHTIHSHMGTSTCYTTGTRNQ